MTPTTLHGLARVLLGALGLTLLALALILLGQGEPVPALSVAGGGAVLLVAAAYEHGRYRAEAARSDRGRFQRTGEVFTDPTTGQRTRVWFDPATGERDYRGD